MSYGLILRLALMAHCLIIFSSDSPSYRRYAQRNSLSDDYDSVKQRDIMFTWNKYILYL